MKRLVAVGLFLISLSIQAKSVQIEFDYEGLDLKEAQAKVELESKSLVCRRVHVGIGGVAVYQKRKTLKARVVDLGAGRGKIVAKYEEGGICDYKIDSVDLNFITSKKRYVHQTSFRVVDASEYAGGNLEKGEILKNSDRQATSLCEMNPARTYTTCYGLVDNGRKQSGLPAVFYMFREYLQEDTTLDNVTLIRK